MSRRVLAACGRARWSVLVTYRRATNRVLDALGWAAGYCMASTWRQTAGTYEPGHRNWRCWARRVDHGRWHRTGAYRWADEQPPIYDPLPPQVVPSMAPRWLANRHYTVGTRGRDRLAVRVAFERIRRDFEALGLPRASHPNTINKEGDQ